MTARGNSSGDHGRHLDHGRHRPGTRAVVGTRSTAVPARADDPEGDRSQTADRHPRTADHHTQTTGHHAQATDHHTQTADHHAQTTGHHTQTTGHDRDLAGGDVARDARAVAETVTDPELPMLTLADLGVLRGVEVAGDGTVVVSVTPTYSGCPAMDAIHDELRARLHAAGHPRVTVRTVLHPAWSTDWISQAGRRKLAAAGLAPPGRAPRRPRGPVPLTLGPPPRQIRCPHCGAAGTELLSAYGATACRSLRRCLTCREPFEHVKEL